MDREDWAFIVTFLGFWLVGYLGALGLARLYEKGWAVFEDQIKEAALKALKDVLETIEVSVDVSGLDITAKPVVTHESGKMRITIVVAAVAAGPEG